MWNGYVAPTRSAKNYTKFIFDETWNIQAGKLILTNTIDEVYENVPLSSYIL